MLHYAYIYIYIVIVRKIMRFFLNMLKSSSQMLNTFEKTKT